MSLTLKKHFRVIKEIKQVLDSLFFNAKYMYCVDFVYYMYAVEHACDVQVVNMSDMTVSSVYSWFPQTPHERKHRCQQE